MALSRDADEPIGTPAAGTQEQRRSRSPGVVALGTLACPGCDVPVSPAGPLRLTAPLHCPVCTTSGPVRDFLSLATPTRAAHVVVRVRSGPRHRRP